MNHCRNTIRRIHEPGGALDRESIQHCLACPACRGELLARLAGGAPDAPPVPEILSRNVLAHCRDGRALKHRRTLRRTLAWSSGVAAAVMIAVGVGFADIATSVTQPCPAAGAEWDGSSLFGAIADVGAELDLMEELLSNEKGKVEI